MSIVLMGSTSGSITLQEPAVAGSTVLELPASSGTVALGSQLGMRNRIINGAMVIDQRNAGAEVNPAVAATYYLDRWLVASTSTSKFKIGQNAGAVTPPAGFTNYLGTTSLSAYSVVSADIFGVQQRIEGFNVADLGWGTANAKTVTLSFWVRSSLTGTFGGAFRNDGSTRSYPYSYTISAANTWEKKSVTIAGDTSGTWLTTNGLGILVFFALGVGPDRSGTAGVWAASNFSSATGAVSVVGTNGATFYITGVQLEVGTQDTSFEYRQYGQELALCQRYYEKSYDLSVAIGSVNSNGVLVYRASGTGANATFPSRFRVEKRGTPTVSIYNPVSGSVDSFRNDTAGTNITVSGVANIGTTGFSYITASAGLTDQQGYFAHYIANAEI